MLPVHVLARIDRQRHRLGIDALGQWGKEQHAVYAGVAAERADFARKVDWRGGRASDTQAVPAELAFDLPSVRRG